jgi:hypothetical protein
MYVGLRAGMPKRASAIERCGMWPSFTISIAVRLEFVAARFSLKAISASEMLEQLHKVLYRTIAMKL